MKKALTILLLLAAGTAPGKKPGEGDLPPKNWMTYDEIDANHDGKITLDEFKAAQEKIAQGRFKKIDQNGDGQLTKDELEGDHKHLAETNPALAERLKKHGVDFANMDRDGSGAASLDEYIASAIEASVERFKKIDANGDGIITRDEMDAALQAVKAAHDAPAKREGKRGKPDASTEKPAK
jgi:Ca2+-binding EF-hand superfamily protein